MIDPKRREMFVDLYRIAEYCEKPPFKPGDIEGNALFFERAIREQLQPFLKKYDGMPLASTLAVAIMDDCSHRAAEFNKM